MWITDQNGFSYWEPDEGYGGGAPIISPVTNAPEPEPTPPAPTPAPNPEDAWKPDFNQPDPWVGMPPDYGGVATYIPDPASGSVTPPWQGSEGAAVAGIPDYGTPEYKEKAVTIAEKTLEPFKAPDGTYDVEKIVSSGKVEYLRGLGIEESSVKNIQGYAETTARQQRAARALSDFKQADGYDLAGALEAGKEDELKALGFTSEQIALARSYKTAKTLTKKQQQEQQGAKEALLLAGFMAGSKPKGWAGETPTRQFTIPEMAAYARSTPEGMTTLREYGFTTGTLNDVNKFNDELKAAVQRVEDYLAKGDKIGGPGLALSLAIRDSGLDVEPVGAELVQRGTMRNQYKDTDTGKILTPKELVEAKWKALDKEQQLSIAALWDKDYTKGSYFAAVTKGMSDVAARNGLLGQVAFGAILPVTQPVAKQMTLTEARRQLGENFATELVAVSEYMNTDGSVDMKRLDAALKDKKTADRILGATGYKKPGDLKGNLEYYNQATRVTPKEWAVAGLVAAMDIMTVGGGGALPGVAGRAVSEVVPVALAGVTFPDVIKAMTSPGVTVGEKALTAGTQLLLLHGLVGPVLRGGQFVKTVAKGEYVPLRSMSMEKPTARVPFTDIQLAAMRKAGITEARIIEAGTQITEQLLTGKKVATVDLGPIRIEVKNVPYQQQGSVSVFHGTPDVTLIDRGGNVPLIKKFFTAGKVAIEPMERSYLSGQRATRPGIIEVKITDPALLKKIAPQERLINGKRVIEPEAALPSLEELRTMGYMLEPIPGPAGRGVSFDATLGELQIRRFNLVKTIENPMGLQTIRIGGSGPRGTVALGDLHGTRNFKAVFDDINGAYDKPVIKGNPSKPETWSWVGEKQTIATLGDVVDRGPAFETWRTLLNRLDTEANATGGKVQRLVGNHELAYLSGDAISGVKVPDATRSLMKKALKEDVLSGRVKAAVAEDGVLFTHAGVSLDVFPEYAGKTAQFVADDLNAKFLRAVKNDNYGDKMFAKGRVEKGHSLSYNERAQGGIFWLRPQEAPPSALDLGFTQVVGHNPGPGVRQLWGKNFIEVDVARGKGGKGVFSNTPFSRTEAVPIKVEAVGGRSAGAISAATLAKLKVRAMGDTVADMVLGWDGRIYAVDQIKSNKVALKAFVKGIDKQIAEREAAGDSFGARLLMRQKSELMSPTGKDYLYGGISFWRDIVMGRQNSVKVTDAIGKTVKSDMAASNKGIAKVRSKIAEMSDKDVSMMFGRSKKSILDDLDARSAKALIEMADDGLARNVAPHLDRALLVDRYSRLLDARVRLQSNLGRQMSDVSRPGVPAASRAISPDRTRLSDVRTGGVERVPTERIEPIRRPPLDRIPARSPTERIPSERVPVGERAPSGRTPAERIPGDRVPPPDRPPGRTPPPPDRTPPPIDRIPEPVPPDRIPPPEKRLPGGEIVTNGPPPTRPNIIVRASDSQKRDAIVSNKGAIAWRQGEVGAKGGGRDDRWDVLLWPYEAKSDHIMVFGRRPANATIVRGPGSAKRTAQLLFGKTVSREVRHDIGLFDAEVAPASGGQAVRLTFEYAPQISGTTNEQISSSGRVFPLNKGTGQNKSRLTPNRKTL
jgi:hypothetical protein